MKKYFIPFLTLIILSCSNLKQLPKEHYYEFLYYFERTFKNDTLYFKLKNPLMCPLTIKLSKDSLNTNLENIFGQQTLKEAQDTVVIIKYPNYNKASKIRYIVKYGNPDKQIIKNKIEYPFPYGKKYKIIQGYNGKFSHNSIYSQYAIDFNLKIGDTVTSVDEGYVVGLIQDYKEYGSSKKWLENDKSNFIIIYHPHSGLFTQYVHLHYKGSLVKLGEFVKKKQPIAISGMTGFTTTPHLHFNVKIPSEKYGLISTTIEFDGEIQGQTKN